MTRKITQHNVTNAHHCDIQPNKNMICTTWGHGKDKKGQPVS